MRDKIISKDWLLQIGVGFLFLPAFIIICFGCSEDKVVTPSVNPLEGTWAEEYFMQFGYAHFSDSTGPLVKTLTSTLHLSAGNFGLIITDDSGQVLEDLSGEYTISSNNLIFHNIDEYPPTMYGETVFKMHYRIGGKDTLYISMANPDYPIDIVILSPIGFLWLVCNQEAGLTQPVGTKISGVFSRQN